MPIPLSWPFAQWGLDMVGKLHKASPGGYEYMLVAVDKFTKWIEAKPINSPDGASAIKFVKSIVFRFGVPHSIVTDNGSNFTSKEFKAYCAEVGIKLHFASVAHPQTNGQVEKANGIICNGIKKRLKLIEAIHHLPTGYRSVARLAIAGRVPVLRAVARGTRAHQQSGSLPALRVARRCSPVGFGRQHILARPVGHSTATASTSAAEMADGPITYEDLPEEHKKKYDEIKAVFEADLIGSFERTRKHGIRWKGFSPEGVLDESLVNAFERIAVRVVQEIMKHQYSPSGPALGTYQGEIPFQTRPQLPFTLAAPEPQGSPAYVVYKIGGDPGDCQFLYEPPKEIPHGYGCTYVPDCNNLARTNQIAAGGISGADADKHAWLAKYATGTSHESSTPAAHTVEQISTILRDQFGILPKRRTVGYSKPYPNEYDLIPLPPKYRLPEFSKFNGSEGSSSIEHVSRYLAQLGMISASDPLRVRFFAQSLTGPAFGWYTSLPPDSVRTWKQLEEQFHVQYHSEATEAGIADLAQVRQKRGETVSEYIQRFRTVKNRCYSARLTEKEAVDLAALGLAAPIKDLAFQVEYNSLAHMAQINIV
ncbi:hypothetical protein QYE76_058418 [Lolium multiflorum]|uniref:Integrase catalytic domain-containing protein n=1 Tax=Lolium multiflorum TaxID=4521 RepID=A0AAD8T6I9_LOLMU|nr:hypothetical protein QYE76_058418 [Lolium multiflorum]